MGKRRKIDERQTGREIKASQEGPGGEGLMRVTMTRKKGKARFL